MTVLRHHTNSRIDPRAERQIDFLLTTHSETRRKVKERDMLNLIALRGFMPIGHYALLDVGDGV